MDIFKIIGIGFLTIIISIILKEYRKEYALYSILIGGGIIIFLSLETINEIINFVNNFSENNNSFIKILIKITGIFAVSTLY